MKSNNETVSMELKHGTVPHGAITVDDPPRSLLEVDPPCSFLDDVQVRYVQKTKKKKNVSTDSKTIEGVPQKRVKVTFAPRTDLPSPPVHVGSSRAPSSSSTNGVSTSTFSPALAPHSGAISVGGPMLSPKESHIRQDTVDAFLLPADREELTRLAMNDPIDHRLSYLEIQCSIYQHMARMCADFSRYTQFYDQHLESHIAQTNRIEALQRSLAERDREMEALKASLQEHTRVWELECKELQSAHQLDMVRLREIVASETMEKAVHIYLNSPAFAEKMERAREEGAERMRQSFQTSAGFEAVRDKIIDAYHCSQAFRDKVFKDACAMYAVGHADALAKVKESVPSLDIASFELVETTESSVESREIAEDSATSQAGGDIEGVSVSRASMDALSVVDDAS